MFASLNMIMQLHYVKRLSNYIHVRMILVWVFLERYNTARMFHHVWKESQAQ